MKGRHIYLVALPALLVGCDDERVGKVQDAVKDRVSALSAKYEESKVLLHVDQFTEAVEKRDMQRLKRLCSECGNPEYKAIMACYYNAFVVEDGQGVEAARKYLADETAREDNPPAKDKALKALSRYFEAKGSLRTKEVAALILILGLESQYPHRGAVIGGLVAEKLGLIDPSSKPSQPTGSVPSSAPAG